MMIHVFLNSIVYSVKLITNRWASFNYFRRHSPCFELCFGNQEVVEGPINVLLLLLLLDHWRWLVNIVLSLSDLNRNLMLFLLCSLLFLISQCNKSMHGFRLDMLYSSFSQLLLISSIRIIMNSTTFHHHLKFLLIWVSLLTFNQVKQRLLLILIE